MEACGQMGKILHKLLFLFILFGGNSSTDQISRSIFTLDGSNEADSRKDEPFGVSSVLRLT